MKVVHREELTARYVLTAFLFVCTSAFATPSNDAVAKTPQAIKMNPKAVLSIMEHVADRQLAHPGNYPPASLTQGVFDAGVMALAGISGNGKYLEAMKAAGEANGWRPGERTYSADDYCLGQTYAELYLRYGENDMIDSLRRRFDYILANPSGERSQGPVPSGRRRPTVWSSCDALFMGPATWIRLYAATRDTRYLDFAIKNWWKTTSYLYDRQEHLFYSDDSSLNRRGPNGKKIFPSGGNGLVLAGLVRVLQYLPMNYQGRPRFVNLFNEMARKILSLQQPDSLWHAVLLDPADHPEKEISGSSLFVYALAWGVNQGLLDRTKFEPAIMNAWYSLARCVDQEGILTSGQPAGGDQQKFERKSIGVDDAGDFLLAGSEVYRMAVLERSRSVRIVITNPASISRESETVELKLKDIAARLHLDPEIGKFAVMDGVSSRIMDSQTYASVPGQTPDRLLFQVDLAPHETRTYYILDASKLPAVPPPIVKTFARFVPERYDDFAWENDRIAHRMYGQALMTAPGEALTSSGIDVWIKKTRKLIVNELYRTGEFHNDSGSAMDDYRVGAGRGDGGVGVWDGKTLYVSKNYHHWRLLTTGPIRSEFELTFDPWSVGDGRTVSELARISIDAGTWMSKAVCTFVSNERTPLTVGVGLAERSCGPDGHETIANDRNEGWMTYWQPEDKPKGITGVAIVLPKGSVEEFTNDNPDLPDSVLHAAVPQPIVEGAPSIRDLLALTKVKAGKPLTYFFAACWNKSGDFVNNVQWDNYVRRFAELRDQSLKVKVEGE